MGRDYGRISLWNETSWLPQSLEGQEDSMKGE